MPNMRVTVFGLDNMDAAIKQFGPSFANRLLQPALYAARIPIRDKAKQRMYGFTDRSGQLRRSIKLGYTTAVYFGRRYKRGRGAVFAGNRRAFYAHFVERGHGGPFPARPHPYLGLDAAFDDTREAQRIAFLTKARELFLGLVQEFNYRGIGIPLDRRTGRVAIRFGAFR